MLLIIIVRKGRSSFALFSLSLSRSLLWFEDDKKSLEEGSGAAVSRAFVRLFNDRPPSLFWQTLLSEWEVAAGIDYSALLSAQPKEETKWKGRAMNILRNALSMATRWLGGTSVAGRFPPYFSIGQNDKKQTSLLSRVVPMNTVLPSLVMKPY